MSALLVGRVPRLVDTDVRPLVRRRGRLAAVGLTALAQYRVGDGGERPERERVRTAARTGRRVGRLAFAFGALAAVAYAVLRERSQSDRSETAAPSDERADISIDESGNATDE